MSEAAAHNTGPIAKVDFSDDKMKAYLTVNDPDEDITITPGDLINIMNGAGVKFGIDKDLIKKILDEKKWDEKLLVARGQLPVPGENASLEFSFPTEKSFKPQIKENGHVDYKELSIVHSVAKDDVLITRIAAKLGAPGTDVMGNEIPPVYGKDTKAVPGKGTYIDPKNDNIIRAAIDGIVYYDPAIHKVEVQKLYVVNSSVDYSTGNVRVNSSVLIRGEVKSGFSITSPYDVEIIGVVDHAIIKCEGTLKVHSGIIGDENIEMNIGGDLHASYVESQKIKCGGSVYIGNEISSSKIESRDEIVLTKSNGVIMGGHLIAINKISAPYIGNVYSIPTILEVGIDLNYRERYFLKVAQRIAMEKQVNNLQEKISGIMKETNDQRKEKQLESIKSGWEQSIVQLENLKKYEEKLEALYYSAPNPLVLATARIYPGTIVKIKSATFMVKEEMQRVQFKFEEGDIIYSKI